MGIKTALEFIHARPIALLFDNKSAHVTGPSGCDVIVESHVGEKLQPLIHRLNQR